MNQIAIKAIRYSEDNLNIEALRGTYGQLGDKNATFTIIKNLLIVNLQANAKYDNVKLPSCYNGFVMLSNNQILQIKDSTLSCNLDSNTTGFGILVLKKWN